MGYLGSENNETNTVKGNSDADDGDTQPLEFDSQFSPFSGEGYDNTLYDWEYLENRQSRDDTALANSAFEMQRLNDTEETQVLDSEGDFSGALENQLCEFDKEETVGLRGVDQEDAVGTKLLTDVDGLADDDSLTRCSDSQVEDDSKQVGSTNSAVENVSCSAGSVKQGFTSIRTASLRNSGLSARKKTALKSLESGDVITPNDVKSTEQCSDAVNQEYEVGRVNEGMKRLSHECNTNLGSSVTDILDLENSDMSEHEHEENTDVGTGGDNLAGLSYVNSQEPGESSQANALDFVDRLLKSDVCVLDLHTRNRDDAFINPNSAVVSAKGIQKLAKKVNTSCSLAEIGVYNWDASHEDEGGGEFLSRNKNVLFGDIPGTRKSLTEPQKLKNIQQVQRRTHQKPINEEPGSTAMDQIEKMNIIRNLNSSFENQICKGQTNTQLGREGNAAEMCETYDVGVDTQMAAEAIEALSNIVFPSDENAVKQNAMQKRVHSPDLGVTTRSKQIERTTDQVGVESKKFVISRTRSKNVRKKVIKVNGSKRRQKTEKITDLKEDGVHDERIFKVQEKVNKGTRQRNLDDNKSTPAKKQRLEEKINISAPIASRTRRNKVATVNAASESPANLQMKAKKLRLVDAEDSGRKLCNGHSDDKSKFLLEESVRHAGQSITRQRRSNRRVRSSKQIQPNLSSNENNACSSQSAQKAQPEFTQRTSKETEKASISASTAAVNCRKSIITSSPICMGDEYYKLSCKKNPETSSLMKELNSLSPSLPKCYLSNTGLRKRRDMASIRVLFSHHLGEDTIRHQKKILARLGVSAASSMLVATHFVANEFARTRNMLEAIAHGKPVVNHLWLESCEQAGCYMDERNYILRDAKKEKELGFNMQVSLARASQHPLLEGRRVLITPNTKPGVEILSNLVKAVHGQAFERICRSILKGDILHDDLLILSCEEDYEFCRSLLEKGALIYDSELLLNGIITQKLEFERHILFVDHVKRTRSTIWLKKDGKQFHTASRCV